MSTFRKVSHNKVYIEATHEQFAAACPQFCVHQQLNPLPATQGNSALGLR